MDEMAFFHQGTQLICGSLDVDKVLKDCLPFLKIHMPLSGILLEFMAPEVGWVQNIAQASEVETSRTTEPILPSPSARRYAEENKGQVMIFNHGDASPIAREIAGQLDLEEVSFIVMPLEIDQENLGVVIIFSEGGKPFSTEHARRLQMLHSPFAIAMSNTLRYREMSRLKELLSDDNRYLNRELHRLSGDEIIGRKFGLREVMTMVGQVAPMDSNVLLLGETGVGKEVIANAVHYASKRRMGPLIKVNCGAIPENLIDSELFGHERGAFTGALKQNRGRFERAHQGTLFLDEIGELPPSAQVRLLRVLQNGEFERVGGSSPITVDVRVIAATNRNLETMVKSGAFREDLWFRLNVFPITIPPLRQRREDIPALVNHFIERIVHKMNLRHRPVPAPGALERLQQYNWPGNVRELENFVEREMIRNQALKDKEALKFEEIRGALNNNTSERFPTAKAESNKALTLDEVNRIHIRRVLNMTNGRIQGNKGAAAILGMHPNTLRHRMRKLGIAFGRGQRLSP